MPRRGTSVATLGAALLLGPTLLLDTLFLDTALLVGEIAVRVGTEVLVVGVGVVVPIRVGRGCGTRGCGTPANGTLASGAWLQTVTTHAVLVGLHVGIDPVRLTQLPRVLITGRARLVCTAPGILCQPIRVGSALVGFCGQPLGLSALLVGLSLRPACLRVGLGGAVLALQHVTLVLTGFFAQLLRLGAFAVRSVAAHHDEREDRDEDDSCDDSDDDPRGGVVHCSTVVRVRLHPGPARRLPPRSGRVVFWAGGHRVTV